MKTFHALALVPLVVSCHFDKLFSGGGSGPPLSHGRPVGLAVNISPGQARAGQPLPDVRVAVVDSAGTPVAGADSLITVELGANPSGTTLKGTNRVRAVNGVATFRDLRIDEAGENYTLRASGGGLQKESAPFNVMPPPSTTGDLKVTTHTTGDTPDPNGYTATVDGSASQSILPNGSVTFSPVASGPHTVDLSDVAPNCTVTNGPQRSVTVPVNGTGTATFDVTCPTPPPTTGNLTVTVTTGGTGSDPDGYTLTVDGANQQISMNDTRTFTGLPAGDHTVALNDVATSCGVAGQNPRTVNVPAGGAQQTNFAVTCTAPVNQPPTARFTPGCTDLSCTFTSTSSDPDGSIVSQEWTFGDGATGSGASVSHTYSRTGSYTVTLTVRDNGGATDVASQQVQVSEPPPPPPNQPPVVTAGDDQHVLLSVLSLTLEGASFSDPDHDAPWIVTINWGDGSAPTTFQTFNEGSIGGQHTYPVTPLGATYTLRVTVRDAHNASSSATKTVFVDVL